MSLLKSIIDFSFNYGLYMSIFIFISTLGYLFLPKKVRIVTVPTLALSTIILIICASASVSIQVMSEHPSAKEWDKHINSTIGYNTSDDEVSTILTQYMQSSYNTELDNISVLADTEVTAKGKVTEISIPHTVVLKRDLLEFNYIHNITLYRFEDNTMDIIIKFDKSPETTEN